MAFKMQCIINAPACLTLTHAVCSRGHVHDPCGDLQAVDRCAIVSNQRHYVQYTTSAFDSRQFTFLKQNEFSTFLNTYAAAKV